VSRPSRRTIAARRSVAALVVVLVAVALTLVLLVSGSGHRAAGRGRPRATSSTTQAPTTASGGSSASSTSSTASSPGGNLPTTGSVTISAVGDTMLGNTPDLPPDPASYFDPIRRELDGGSEIVFGNLEGTLTTANTSKCGSGSPECFAFRDPPVYAKYLRDAGFTILNDANNHSFDFGPAGQAQTVASIHAAGMAQTGLPGEITLVHAGGIPVAFLAFAPYTYDANLLNLPLARRMIEKARQEARVVVVYMHAGAEGADADHVTGQEEYFLGEDRGNAEAFAHMAVDAGASLVIASGPHVLRGMQFYKGHLIAYSLGNFANYGDFASGGVLSMSVILHVKLSATGAFESARIDPVQIVGPGQPRPGGGTVAFIAGLSAQDFKSSAPRFSPTGVITPP
jgi:hypothetical protein